MSIIPSHTKRRSTGITPADRLSYCILNSLLNHLNRALLCALAAVGTFLIINHCQVILHMDGVKLTLLCTQGAADTAGFTYGLHILALGMGTALYQMPCLVGNQLNQVVGTGGHALAAGNAPVSYTHLTLPTKRIV